MMCSNVGKGGITAVTLLALLVQADANAPTFSARLPAQVSWRHANLPAFPVKAATAGAWKVESRKNGYPPVRNMDNRKDAPIKTKIWNIMEGQDAFLEDLKSTFGGEKVVRKSSSPKSQTVVIDGVTVPEIKGFLRGTDNYYVTEGAAAKLADKKRVKEAVELNRANRKKNEEKKAAKEAAEGGEGGEEAVFELFATNGSDIVSTLALVLIGFVVGSGVTFAMFYRSRASSAHKEPFLVAA
eukprot:gnl/TRDRNA2_/TRDRNA2_152458_c0_seq2.p1 gnl/TRDRNA2_/TRDRNA2_152458_c0~~gnl/TRDRNA2_/TRDRNA2_152458_c0_seq2.p1  ORF type:complete len:241 (-),score=57.37 gnl/TRDRNA2_/TRDRNA2_152458_c0_seq2:299-1021(-)